MFESLVLECFGDCLGTDDLQFGFKPTLGCNNAIFTLRSTIDHFTSRGSSVYAAALDITKAFDTVHHFKLFKVLMNAGLPKCLIMLITSWYAHLEVNVRWNMTLSNTITVGSGVRQGGVLSPSLFNLFINAIIVNLKRLGFGCHINKVFFGCVMYADDLIIISASLNGLQEMLDECVHTCVNLSLTFNVKKSCCLYFGPHHINNLCVLKLGSDLLTWNDSIKYLGVYFVSGKCVSIDTSATRRKFFMACNSIFKSSNGLSEVTQLFLQKSYALSILTYGIVSTNLSRLQLLDINACWNSVYRRIFNFNRWESVKLFICGLGDLDFKHLYTLLTYKFYLNMEISSNSAVQNSFKFFKYTNEFLKFCCNSNWNRHTKFYAVKNIIQEQFKYDICAG